MANFKKFETVLKISANGLLGERLVYK